MKPKRKKVYPEPGRRVFVAMSGGVDSSVAAYLLKRDGYNVVGVFMRCYNIDGCAERDAEDARRVAGHLGIPFYVWDFEEEYKKRVVEYMIDGYRRGLTPNPDVECNREIKFGLFFDRAHSLGADVVATGHYVQLRRGVLFVARDKNKDQSYFLWTLTQQQLKHCLFPIGDYTKPQVRAIARRAKLPTANKKDSQGICFLGNVSVQDFLRQYLPERRGAVLTTDGRKIGEHAGAHFYTIGQRHIGVANSTVHRANGRDPKRLYVAEKNIRKNTLVVAEGQDAPELFTKELTLRGVNVMSSTHSNILQNVGVSVWARVRYRQPVSSAKLRRLRRGRYLLAFAKPQKFVAPGQSAVFYKRQGTRDKGQGKYEMFGGGIIV